MNIYTGQKLKNYVGFNIGDVTEILHVTDDADVSGGKLSGSPSDWIQCPLQHLWWCSLCTRVRKVQIHSKLHLTINQQ